MRFCFIVALFCYCFWSKSQQGGKIGVRDYSFFFDNRYFVGIDICYTSSLYAYHGRGVEIVYSHAYDSDFAVSGKKEETARKNFLKRHFVPPKRCSINILSVNILQNEYFDNLPGRMGFADFAFRQSFVPLQSDIKSIRTWQARKFPTLL